MCRDSELLWTQVALPAIHNATWLTIQESLLNPSSRTKMAGLAYQLAELRGEIWTIIDLQKEVISA